MPDTPPKPDGPQQMVGVTVTRVENLGVEITPDGNSYSLARGEIVVYGDRDQNKPISASITKDYSAVPIQIVPAMVSYPSATTWEAVFLDYESVGDGQIFRAEETEAPFNSTQLTFDVS